MMRYLPPRPEAASAKACVSSTDCRVARARLHLGPVYENA